MEFLTPQAHRSRQRCRWIGLGPLQNGVLLPFPSVLPLMTGCRSLSLSGDNNSAALPSSGVVALSKPDREMMAIHSRAAKNVRLVSGTRPNPLRLDEWFLGGGRAGSHCPALVPFFPEDCVKATAQYQNRKN